MPAAAHERSRLEQILERQGAEGLSAGAPPAVQEALLSGWQGKARALPRQASVLDLTTGGGAVPAAGIPEACR